MAWSPNRRTLSFMRSLPPSLATLVSSEEFTSPNRRSAVVRPKPAFTWSSRLWQLYALLGVALLGVYFFILPNADVRSWVYDGFGPLAALGIVAAVLVHRPRRAWLWLGVAAACVLFGIGDFAFSFLALNGAEVPLPSVADLPYLSGYVVLAASLMLIYLLRRGPGDRVNALDAAIIALALAFVIADPLIDGLEGTPPDSLLAGMTALAYPAMDLLFVWIAVRLILSSKGHSMALGLLAFGLMAFLFADAEFTYTAETYLPGNLVDLGWLVGYVTWAVAAAHPSMRRISAPADESAMPLVTRTRLLILGGAAASPSLGLLLAFSVGHSTVNIVLGVAGSLIMIVLVLARLSMMVLDLRRTVGERDEFRGEVAWHKQYDLQTGLANRAFFQHQVSNSLRGVPAPAAVLVLDIDDFGQINDVLGTATGDKVLSEVATRLKTCFRADDVVARIGGDDFAVLFDGGDLRGTALRVLAALAHPIVFEGRPLRLQASIGIAAAQTDQSDRDLLGDAVVALHVAQVRAKGSFEIFQPGMAEELLAATSLRADLERAVERQEFEVFYQPVLRVTDGEIEGAEALVRWRHPERGLVPPLEFISLAEESGLIVPLGRFVLRAACAQAATWIREHPDHAGFIMEVNLSPAQMRSADLVNDVAAALADSGLAPAQLMLELTEGMLIDLERYEGTLHELKALGVRLAIDDFGTGYSSLSYLGRLPFDVLKIDRSFFLALAAGRPEGALVAVVQQVASTLGLATVAEGIEGFDQFEYLRELGVDLVQSFMFGRPVEADAFAAIFTQTSIERGIAPTCKIPQTSRSLRTQPAQV